MRSVKRQPSLPDHALPRQSGAAPSDGDATGPASAPAVSVEPHTNLRSRLRSLPSVDELRRAMATALATAASAPRAAPPARADRLTRGARAALDDARAQIRGGAEAPKLAVLRDAALRLLADDDRPMLRPVINATGVIINTNLGRAPLGEAAIEQIMAVARGYSNLEYDLATGERGSRQAPVRALLREITGAEDALVVNNNAAAVLLVLSALAQGREVILSRGELVEIGGGFRVPDVLRQSGARLVEVGTTNRTRTRDYEAAITPETALLLSVHPSNFRVIGFTESAPLAELAELAHRSGLALVHDLGSGALQLTERHGIAHEPTVRESIAAGADVVCFSGDKLLGGPQAGIIVGRAATIAAIERHPLARALRSDKLTLAALEATLRSHRDGRASAELPVWRMLAVPIGELRRRAEAWAAALRVAGIAAEAEPGESTVGGGSLPGETLPTVLCAIVQQVEQQQGDQPRGGTRGVGDVAALARRLRAGEPPVVARVLRDRLLLDPRTVPPELDAALLTALVKALGQPSAQPEGGRVPS